MVGAAKTNLEYNFSFYFSISFNRRVRDSEEYVFRLRLRERLPELSWDSEWDLLIFTILCTRL